MIQPNDFGKYKKDDVIKAGFKVIDYGVTYTDLKKDFGINLTVEQRLKYCIGFRCEKNWRGCVPVFDPSQIWLMKEKGEI